MPRAGGVWRSPVAHLLWEQGAGGSNPLTPTIFTPLAEPSLCGFCAGTIYLNAQPAATTNLASPLIFSCSARPCGTPRAAESPAHRLHERCRVQKDGLVFRDVDVTS